MNRARSLTKYAISRLISLPIMLWLISTLIFVLLRIAPGDPVDAILGNRADQVTREAMRTKLGLDDPLFHQYLNFLNDILHGNLGTALNTQEPVRKIISQSLPASIELALAAILIAGFIGFIIGLTGTAKKESSTDFAGRLYGIVTYAIPPFWAAMLIQLIFAVILGWLPIGGRLPAGTFIYDGSGFLIFDSIKNGDLNLLQQVIRHLILPASTLGLLLSGIFSRSLKINLDKTLNMDYIEAAKSRGISNSRIIFFHALPNALLPVLTIAGLTVASLIGGALLIEITFSWPGIAMLLQEAISQRDYPIVQGIVVVISILVVSIGLFIDLLIAFIDPRVSY